MRRATGATATGGLIAGYAMSNGHGYGTHYNSYAGFQYYRLEIHEDNLIYIKKVDKEVSEDCRDATEFQPPIIIDGELLVSDYWVETNPLRVHRTVRQV